MRCWTGCPARSARCRRRGRDAVGGRAGRRADRPGIARDFGRIGVRVGGKSLDLRRLSEHVVPGVDGPADRIASDQGEGSDDGRDAEQGEEPSDDPVPHRQAAPVGRAGAPAGVVRGPEPPAPPGKSFRWGHRASTAAVMQRRTPQGQPALAAEPQFGAVDDTATGTRPFGRRWGFGRRLVLRLGVLRLRVVARRGLLRSLGPSRSPPRHALRTGPPAQRRRANWAPPAFGRPGQGRRAIEYRAPARRRSTPWRPPDRRPDWPPDRRSHRPRRRPERWGVIDFAAPVLPTAAGRAPVRAAAAGRAPSECRESAEPGVARVRLAGRPRPGTRRTRSRIPFRGRCVPRSPGRSFRSPLPPRPWPASRWG